MNIQVRLGENLRRLRMEKDLSQEAFAYEAKIHRTYISDLERGARNPTIRLIEKLALALDVKVSQLLD